MAELQTSEDGSAVRGGNGTFTSIQALRGLAAILVTIVHAVLIVDRSEASFRLGNAGVDLFFVISGFIMWAITCRRPPTPWTFLKHRLQRIVPLYYIFTGLFVSAWLLVPQAFPNTHKALADVLYSLAFVPHIAADGSTMPVLAQGWTLEFEMAFYLVFALALTAPTRARLPLVVIGLGALPLVGLGLAALGVTGAMAPPVMLLSPLLYEFVAGILIAAALDRGLRPKPVWCWIAVALGLALWLLLPPPAADDDWARISHFGLPAILIIGSAVTLEASGALRFSGPSQWLGDASYSIYLSHTFTISALAKIWPVAASPLAFVGAASIAGIAVGLVVHVTLERPIAQLLKRRRQATLRPAPATAPTFPAGLAARLAGQDARDG